MLKSSVCWSSDGQSKGYGFASFENADGLTAAVSDLARPLHTLHCCAVLLIDLLTQVI